jgi:hypothetical protein
VKMHSVLENETEIESFVDVSLYFHHRRHFRTHEKVVEAKSESSSIHSDNQLELPSIPKVTVPSTVSSASPSLVAVNNSDITNEKKIPDNSSSSCLSKTIDEMMLSLFGHVEGPSTDRDSPPQIIPASHATLHVAINRAAELKNYTEGSSPDAGRWYTTFRWPSSCASDSVSDFPTVLSTIVFILNVCVFNRYPVQVIQNLLEVRRCGTSAPRYRCWRS